MANLSTGKIIDLNGLSRFWEDLKAHTSFICDCETPSSTAIKRVSLPQFKLVAGAVIVVNFVTKNTEKEPLLKVNDNYEAVSIIGPDGALTTDQAKLLDGYCEFIYNGENFVFISAESRIRNQVVYGDEPEKPFAGMIWFKPVETTETEEEETEQTVEEQLAAKDATIADLQEQIRLLQEQIAGEG